MIRAVIFDWGDTIMRDFPTFPGAMVTWPRVELVDGAAEALAAIAGQYTICLASNAGQSDAELMGQALDRVGIRGYFDHLWTSKELGAAKPDRRFFQEIAAHLGVVPGACAMVGNDYAKDIAGAAAAGMRTVWLNPEGAPAPGRDASVIIKSLAALPGALASL